jgi:NADH-quinone oxidoreductase subunit E
MADRQPAPDTPELRERWGSFAFNEAYEAKAQKALARYPEGRQKSAVMPLLDLEYVANYLDMPVIRVLEVATFYFMYNLKPVGKYHVQVCGTTPCMLRGSDDIIAACKARGMKKGEVSEDGLWTLTEVECMGNCATAPMVQINDDNYEDLTPERLDAVLDALAKGEQPKTGTQEPGRHTSEPSGGPTTLKEMVTENHDYRGEW